MSLMFQKIADYTELLLPDYLLREGSVIEQMITLIPESYSVKILEENKEGSALSLSSGTHRNHPLQPWAPAGP